MKLPSLPAPLRWVPAFILMVIIFTLSSLPGNRLPYFGIWDVLLKKAGHALGYGLLGLAYFSALPRRLSFGYRWLLALLMAVLFALSDEFHQSFVEGRGSSIGDVVIDGFGAAMALMIAAPYSSNSNSKSTS
jgi:VanZ family protein